jgi:MEDS: MEthanogen/methylotroph, DcmR Sensory domain
MDTGRAATIGQSEVHSPCHACAFFHSREEEYELLLPFASDGYQAGDRLFQLLDKDHRDERRRRLSSSGVDLEKAEGAGQLEILPWEEAYLRGNRFDQDAMLELVDSVLREGPSKGFPMTRLWANMEWALEDLPGVHDIVEYEARANKIVPRYPAICICTYDLNKFSAPVVMDVMRTHPQVIIGGVLQENPFYVPPDEFLSELRHRRM